jgi:NADP-reducing hydrogenase subunit HndC
MQENRIALRNIGKYDGKNLQDAILLGAFNSLGMTIKHYSNVDIIESIIDSGLRGRGGAGFPTGLKFKFTASEDGD